MLDDGIDVFQVGLPFGARLAECFQYFVELVVEGAETLAQLIIRAEPDRKILVTDGLQEQREACGSHG